jgi:hypothetical protein
MPMSMMQIVMERQLRILAVMNVSVRHLSNLVEVFWRREDERRKGEMLLKIININNSNLSRF